MMKRTALFDLHVKAGARMVEFAGYEMPVQYQLGVKKEHLWVRENAGLFDVSHMGQLLLSGEGVKQNLEKLMPVDVQGLAFETQRYGLLTNETGGILDDLMFANWGDQVFAVVNAGCKEQDINHLMTNLGESNVEVIQNRSLLALQGPKARAVLTELLPEVAHMTFMQSKKFVWQEEEIWVSCSGYTGEDGYEISVANSSAQAFSEQLLLSEAVEWIGLGARDSLRLEAGLCLYGNDIDTETTPAEASIAWAIQKCRRLEGDRAGGFAGAEVILPQLSPASSPVTRKRIGFTSEGKAPIRAGVEIVDDQGKVVGQVSSGGFSPSLNAPIMMAYINTNADQTNLFALVRGKSIALKPAKMPFVPTRYFRGE